MPSPRSRATSGFLRRLDVRLVLALSSVAFAALLVSGIALSQFLPDYFAQLEESRLTSAANSTAILIQDTLERLEPAKYSSVSDRQGYIQRAAQVAATSLAEGTVAIYYGTDGALAAVATPANPEQLTARGLRLDPDVTPRAVDYTVTLPEMEIPIRIIVSDPFTSRAATLGQVRGTLIGAGVVAVIGSVLLGVLAARRLTGPINRLRRVSARLALGELDQRAAPSGVVEIDQLAVQFNVMADRLAESLRLLQADRDRLREFIADVSHELRTPIAALRTFNDLQADGSVDEATRAEFIDRSREQLRRLEWLSTNLLDLSRIEAGIFPLDVRDGDLREPVRSVVEAHAEMAEERGVTLTAAVPGEVVSLRFDRERIVQLVNNLVGNALKFTPRGGEVDVHLTDSPSEAVIEVRDSGPGIPERELPRIFERFYRGTNVGEARASGSGLGLAIARSIVEMHGGSIDVASAVGHGTSFRAHLPRLSEPALSLLAARDDLPRARAPEAAPMPSVDAPVAAEAGEP